MIDSGMILFVWFLLFFLLFWIVILVSYWEELLRMKNIYTKEELVNLRNIFLYQMERINPGNTPSGYFAFFLGILTGWFLTLFGGLLSPDTGPEPDFVTGEMPNYFFQSALFAGILHIVLPSLRTYLEEKPYPYLQEFLQKEKPFLVALSVTLSSITLTNWGIYHEIHFLFVLINGLILLSYAMYLIQKSPPAKKNENVTGDYEDDFSDIDYDTQEKNQYDV